MRTLLALLLAGYSSAAWGAGPVAEVGRTFRLNESRAWQQAHAVGAQLLRRVGPAAFRHSDTRLQTPAGELALLARSPAGRSLALDRRGRLYELRPSAPGAHDVRRVAGDELWQAALAVFRPRGQPLTALAVALTERAGQGSPRRARALVGGAYARASKASLTRLHHLNVAETLELLTIDSRALSDTTFRLLERRGHATVYEASVSELAKSGMRAPPEAARGRVVLTREGRFGLHWLDANGRAAGKHPYALSAPEADRIGAHLGVDLRAAVAATLGIDLPAS
jgi:hypothetical protein